MKKSRKCQCACCIKLKKAKARMKVYEETLRQIADGPRNTMARRNARATLAFVNAMTDERFNDRNLAS